MRLCDLFTKEEAEIKKIDANAEISAIETDSRKAQSGSLFFALKGSEENGERFVSEAYLNGAAAIVTESREVYDLFGGGAVLVSDAREALSLAASRFYGEAHKKVDLIGVVGTNGKTSVTYILEAVLKAAGKNVLVVGTLGMEMNGKSVDTSMTTPDPLTLHRGIYEAWKNGADSVVMEVSAHAIYWKKIYGLYFDALIFTNFSEDHLDFFKSMEQYKAVKKSIFSVENARFAVLNADDAVGRELIKENSIPYVSYGVDNPADVFPVDVSVKGGVRFIANLFDELEEIRSNLYGAFNVLNLLAALTAARVLKVSAETAAKAIRALAPIPGRFNVYKKKKTVVVDYAHTPDGLENLLHAARKLTDGKILLVFGCGGNRDPYKRPVMGEIAGRLADFTIITTDNSRLEDPERIMDGIEKGIETATEHYVRIRDRKSAIVYAITMASVRDVVVVAGKGEENYIDENGKKTFYMDKLVVEEALRRY